MNSARIKSLLESLIFVSESPLKVSEMCDTLRRLEVDADWKFSQFDPLPESEEKAGEEMASIESMQEPASETEEAFVLDVLGESIDQVRQEREAVDGVESAGDETPTETLSLDALAQIQQRAVVEQAVLGRSDVAALLKEMAAEYEADPRRGVLLCEVAGGWQFRTRPENAAAIHSLFQPKPTKLSKPSMETLSIVAYRQPLTRAEIDEIRGVDSGGVLKTLCEKNLVRIVGKKDEVGKPILYGTTHEFLEVFNLRSLKDLPGLKDYRDLEEEFRKRSEAEGVVLPQSSEEDDAVPLSQWISEEPLTPLNDEEEAMLVSLEENIKEVRLLEREIFHEESPKEAESGESTTRSQESPSA